MLGHMSPSYALGGKITVLGIWSGVGQAFGEPLAHAQIRHLFAHVV